MKSDKRNCNFIVTLLLLIINLLLSIVNDFISYIRNKEINKQFSLLFMFFIF